MIHIIKLNVVLYIINEHINYINLLKIFLESRLIRIVH